MTVISPVTEILHYLFPIEKTTDYIKKRTQTMTKTIMFQSNDCK